MIPKEITELEDLYDQEIDLRILQGEIHPRIQRWYKEDIKNDQPIDLSESLRTRYLTCKKCEDFLNEIKMCKICNCFMPLKVQLKKSKCPKGKW
jgi:hypothetical protein